MDKQIRKRIMRNIIQNADRIVVLIPSGAVLLSSLDVRTVFRLMNGMLGVVAMHRIIRRPYAAPTVTSVPAAYPVRPPMATYEH